MNIFKVLSAHKARLTETNNSAMLVYLLDPNEDHGLGHALLYFGSYTWREEHSSKLA